MCYSQVVRWFLATDSLALRQQAKVAYGDKLVTALQLPLAHTRAEQTKAARQAGAAKRGEQERWDACLRRARLRCQDGTREVRRAYGRWWMHMEGREVQIQLRAAVQYMNGCIVACRKLAFQAAGAEMWLMSLTDYQVRNHHRRENKQNSAIQTAILCLIPAFVRLTMCLTTMDGGVVWVRTTVVPQCRCSRHTAATGG